MGEYVDIDVNKLIVLLFICIVMSFVWWMIGFMFLLVVIVVNIPMTRPSGGVLEMDSTCVIGLSLACCVCWRCCCCRWLDCCSRCSYVSICVQLWMCVGCASTNVGCSCMTCWWCYKTWRCCYRGQRCCYKFWRCLEMLWLLHEELEVLVLVLNLT